MDVFFLSKNSKCRGPSSTTGFFQLNKVQISGLLPVKFCAQWFALHTLSPPSAARHKITLAAWTKQLLAALLHLPAFSPEQGSACITHTKKKYCSSVNCFLCQCGQTFSNFECSHWPTGKMVKKFGPITVAVWDPVGNNPTSQSLLWFDLNEDGLYFPGFVIASAKYVSRVI